MNLNAAFDRLSRINDRYISLKNDFESIVSEQGAFSSAIKNKARKAADAWPLSPGYYPIRRKSFITSKEEALREEALDKRKDELSQHVTRLRTALTQLSALRHDLRDLRQKVDKRGFGIFKHGDVKQRMDRVVSMGMLDSFKRDITSCLNAYHDVYLGFRGCRLPSIQPILNWRKTYRQDRETHHSGRLETLGTTNYAVLG